MVYPIETPRNRANHVITEVLIVEILRGLQKKILQAKLLAAG